MKKLIPVLLLIPLFTGCAGAAALSPPERIYVARQLHTEAMRTANALIENNIIKTQKEKDVVWESSEEIYTGINEAEAKFAAGDTLGYSYWMKRVASSLTRLARLNAQNRQKLPATANRRTAWVPPKSLPLSSVLHRPSASYWNCTKRSRPAAA